MKHKMTRLDYGQFLLSSQVNDTLTYFADHSEKYTHDVLNRYLREDRITPSLVWDNVKSDLIPDENGYLLFDDTVLDKHHSFNTSLFIVSGAETQVKSSKASGL